jgi:hypothetical protein
VQLDIDRVGSDLAGMEAPPERDEAVVVLAVAERTGAMPGGERGRLVEEEQLGEAAGLHELIAVPAAELQPAGDPALAVVPPADVPVRVVKAATVSIDQTTRGVCRQFTERRDPVLPRHLGPP